MVALFFISRATDALRYVQASYGVNACDSLQPAVRNFFNTTDAFARPSSLVVSRESPKLVTL
jgi:hypothetical protein